MRVDQKELLDILAYLPDTGEFFWKHTSESHKAGEMAGKVYQNGYRYICIAGAYFPAALIAWIYMTGEDPEGIIDHKNLDKLDDSFTNLRPASHNQNHANRPAPKHNTSGFKGVLWSTQKKKWQARISVNYKQKHLGFFDDVKDAARAYKKAAIETWGEFALVPSEEEIEAMTQTLVSKKNLTELGL